MPRLYLCLGSGNKRACGQIYDERNTTTGLVPGTVEDANEDALNAEHYINMAGNYGSVYTS